MHVEMRVTLSAGEAASADEPSTTNAAPPSQPIAATDDLVVRSIAVGIKNRVRLGRWSSAVVEIETLRSVSVSLTVKAAAPDGNLASFPGEVTSFSKPGLHRLETTFLAGRNDAEIELTLAGRRGDGGETVGDEFSVEMTLQPSMAPAADAYQVLNADQRLIVTLGQPAGFDSSKRSESDSARTGSSASVKVVRFRPDCDVVELANLSELPLEQAGWQGIGVLVVSGDYQWDDTRDRAVQEWVLAGGHLILSVGKNFKEYQSSRFASWIPCEALGVISLRELSSLESFSNASARIPVRGRVDAIRIASETGKILASSIDGPILMKAPHGMGRVTVLGIDLNRPPLSTWDMLPNFLMNLCELPNLDLQKSSADRFARLSKSNITDLATQIQSSLEDFPEVRRVAVWSVIGWMILCLFMLGIGDYLLVRYLFRRPQLTWITFPVIVVASVALAAWGAAQTNGSQVRVNALNLLGYDAETQTMQCRHWSTVYSPESRRYAARVHPDASVLQALIDSSSSASASGREHIDTPRVRVGWFGMPETSFGGMYRTGGLTLNKTLYNFAPEGAEILNLPISVWSAKTLQAQMKFQTRDLVESRLLSTGVGQLKGPIVHRFPVPLEDWFLAYGGNVFRPRISSMRSGGAGTELPPGRPWDPGQGGVFRRQLKEFLTGTVATRTSVSGKSEQIVVEQTPYLPQQRDAYEILKMLSFHQVAGGKDYTAMNHHLLAELDCSPLLDLNRAVLYGRLKLPVTQVDLDGKTFETDRQVTIIRIVLPVEKQVDELKTLPRYDANPSNIKNIFDQSGDGESIEDEDSRDERPDEDDKNSLEGETPTSEAPGPSSLDNESRTVERQEQ